MPAKDVEKFPKKIKALMNEVEDKIHPWRLCSKGHHWRRGTTQKIGEKDPKIFLPPQIGKCVKSATKKDVLHAEEIIIISAIYFPYLKGSPSSRKLDFGSRGSKFDYLIRGWTRYWNDILRPKTKLDPNIVKALIGSESSFRSSIIVGQARGLMQIMEQTRKILRNTKGELKNHFVVANKKEILDPSVNVCAGVRWLFRKREIASAKLKKQASWEEAIADYKSYLREYRKNRRHRGMGRFIHLYERYKK